ncbi:hypothetical protein [Streptomyces sp. NPDC002521]
MTDSLDEPLTGLQPSQAQGDGSEEDGLSGRAFGGSVDNKASSFPDEDNPGAVFGAQLYASIARLDNTAFIKLRTRVLARDPGETPDGTVARLHRSFYSNGCTSIPQAVCPQQVLDACIQHDFRYVVGPNITANDTDSAEKERTEADEQFRQNLPPVFAEKFHAGVRVFGGIQFRPTPAAGDTLTEFSDVTGTSVALGEGSGE